MEKNSKYQQEYENLYLIKDKTYGIKKVIIYEKEVWNEIKIYWASANLSWYKKNI